MLAPHLATVFQSRSRTWAALILIMANHGLDADFARQRSMWQILKVCVTDSGSAFATKKESAPGPGGIPYGIYRCANGLGSHFLFDGYRFVVERGSVPTRFAASRTVFIPRSSTVDDNGLIVWSLDALRPLTLLTVTGRSSTAICFGLLRCSTRCIHSAQRFVSTRQMTDNIFEVETIALAHFACANT